MSAELESSAGLCSNNKRDLWLIKGEANQPTHSFSCLAFGAANKAAVDEFYKLALAAGGKDNGEPGYRPQYHSGYDAAFVLDPDGHNIEAIYDVPLLATAKKTFAD